MTLWFERDGPLITIPHWTGSAEGKAANKRSVVNHHGFCAGWVAKTMIKRTSPHKYKHQTWLSIIFSLPLSTSLASHIPSCLILFYHYWFTIINDRPWSTDHCTTIHTYYQPSLVMLFYSALDSAWQKKSPTNTLLLSVILSSRYFTISTNNYHYQYHLPG